MRRMESRIATHRKNREALAPRSRNLLVRLATMFSATPPAWPRPRKRNVYQVFTLSWDVSSSWPYAAGPVCLNF